MCSCDAFFLRNSPLLIFLSLVFLYAAGIIFCFHPGVYHNDSLDSLGQAAAGIYRDWHPPIMAATWRVPITLFGWRSALFYLQIFLAIGGTDAFRFRGFSGKQRTDHYIDFFRLGQPTVVLAYLVIVQKDTLYACCMLMACGLMAVWPKKTKIAQVGVFFLIFVLLFYATGVRWNGMAGAIVVLGAASLLISAGLRKRIVTAVAVTIGGSAVMIAGNSFLSYSTLRRRTLLSRAGAILLRSRRAVCAVRPQYVSRDVLKANPNFSMAAIKKVFKSRSADDLFWSHSDVDAPISLTRSPQVVAEIRSRWLSAIQEEPLTYLHHRLLVFIELLKSDSWRVYNFFNEQHGTWVLRTASLGGKVSLVFCKRSSTRHS